MVAEAANAQQKAREEEAGRLASEASFSGPMESEVVHDNTTQVSSAYEGAGEVLLDLGEINQGRSVLDDEFVFDIDFDEIPEPSPAEPAFSASAFRSRDSYRVSERSQPVAAKGSSYASTIIAEPPQPATSIATPDQLADTAEYERVTDEPEEVAAAAVSSEAQVVAAPAEGSLQQLSPEMIDAIARRAVEQLSDGDGRGEHRRADARPDGRRRAEFAARATSPSGGCSSRTC